MSINININININIDFGCAESDCRFMAGRDPTANLRGRPLSAYELSYDALRVALYSGGVDSIIPS